MAASEFEPLWVGRDHASLALLPLGLTNPSETGSRHYAYQLVVDEKPRRFAVTLSPSPAGWPTHHDQLVYLALLQLTVEAGPQSSLEFHRPQLFELLGWPLAGQYFYDRLKAALARLAGLLVVVETQLLSRSGQPYGQSTSGVHLIDSFQIASSYNARCRVQWGELVSEAFALDDFKRLDWHLVRQLDNPLTVSLYRLVDRATLSGAGTWEVGWKVLAQALGMSSACTAARFKQRLAPHCDKLLAHQVLSGWDTARGGQFTFRLPCYLKTNLRRVLGELGVYDEVARQLVARYDELDIIGQCDCHHLAQRGRSGVGHLVEAIRGHWQRRYPPDEAASFAGIWTLFNCPEQATYQQAAITLLQRSGQAGSTDREPERWPSLQRAAIRFMIVHQLDPEQLAPLGSSPA